MNRLERAWRHFVDTPRSKAGKSLLYPLSFFLNVISRVRNKGYDLQFLPSYKPQDMVVISIGNLTVGGTGKTPMTILIANELEKVGHGAILTRGYRRQSTGAFHINQQNLHRYDPKITGDEPYLMAKSTQATIIVNQNRELALKKAEALGCRWALLDDGFQRRQSARDLDIVLIGPKLFGNGLCFPAGPLREPPSSLNRADLIVMIEHSHTDNKPCIIPYAKSPIIKAKWAPQSLISYHQDLPFIQKEPVGLFSGIGNPSLFIDTLKETGLLIQNTLIWGDHKIPNEKKLKAFWSLCQKKGCQKLICTEKDYVKLSQNVKEMLPIYYLKANLLITEGEAILKKKLATLCSIVE